MGAFSGTVALLARTPPRVIQVPPSAFADDWDDKPREPVAMGLRLLSEEDLQVARAEAAKTAWRMHAEDDDEEGRVECHNDTLVRWAVARATCQPEDVRTPWFEMAEDIVKVALTSEGVRHLWNEIERLHLEESPISAEASDDEVGTLAEALATGALWRNMDRADVRRVRRLLRHCLDEMLDAAVEVT